MDIKGCLCGDVDDGDANRIYLQPNINTLRDETLPTLRPSLTLCPLSPFRKHSCMTHYILDPSQFPRNPLEFNSSSKIV